MPGFLNALAVALATLVPMADAGATTRQGLPAVRCGAPVSLGRFDDYVALWTTPVSPDLTVVTWVRYLPGTARLGVFSALIGGSGDSVGPIPASEIQLPQASGSFHRAVLSRSAYDELVVAIMTLSAGVGTVTFDRVRAERIGDRTELSVSCDSSLTVQGHDLVALLPARDQVVLAVFSAPLDPGHSIVLRPIHVDGSQDASNALELALPTEPAGLEPMDAVTDGRGGCFVMAAEPLGGTPRILHALPDGRLDPRWPIGGRLLGAGETTVSLALLAADGEGGAYAAWSRQKPPSSDSLVFVAARFDSTGRVVPGWDSTGTTLVSGGPSFQFRTSIAVGRDGMLFGTFSDIGGMFVGALDGHGQPAAGWPPSGHELHLPTFNLDVLGTELKPLSDGRCLAVWSVSAVETQGYDLFASALPLPVGSEPWEPGRHTIVCATETDQFVSNIDCGVGRSPRQFWTDRGPVQIPFNSTDGIYVREVEVGDIRPPEPRLELSSRVRQAAGVRCTWRSMSILDELPQVLVSVDGQPYSHWGEAQRADSWTATANVPFAAGCSIQRIQLAVPGPGGRWTDVAEPVVLDCSPKGPWTIAAVDASQSDVLEVRLLSDGASGPVQLSLFDVAGRKLAAAQCSLESGGESVCRLPAPRRQGFYWVEAKTASYRTTRGTVRTR